MTAKFSTGLNNMLLGGMSWREIFDDSVLDIYAGAIPSDADVAPGGTLLCTYTVPAIGAVTVNPVTGSRGTKRAYDITIPNATNGNTIKIKYTVDGNGGVTPIFTIANPPDTTDIMVAISLARMLNDIPQLSAIADQVATGPSKILVECRIAGLALTLANDGGTTTATVTARQAAARVGSLQFGVPAAVADSEIDKNTDVWQGTTITPGTAAFFRLITTRDSRATSPTNPRIQGSVSTSGADLNLPSLNFVAGGVNIINSGAIILPKTA